ncbi:MAG: hypothetical protein WC943_17585 [Elusimicrobiota bacterium]|jgi:hypothetical protein
MDPTPQDQEASRTRRTYLLLTAVALLLIIPLVIAAYLRMSDTTKSGTPGANIMSVFEKREGRGPLQPSPIVSAAPIAKQDSLVKPVGETYSQEASTAPTSLMMITGMPEPKPVQVPPPPPGQAATQPPPPPSPEMGMDLSALVPKNPAEAPKAPSKSAWAPPKLGQRQSGLRPVSWSTDKSKGAPGAGTTAPQAPADAQAMPPGMDPSALMKNMMPGMDMSKMMQGVGGTSPAAGTTDPSGQ